MSPIITQISFIAFRKYAHLILDKSAKAISWCKYASVGEKSEST